MGYALRVGTARAIALRPSATARRIMRARGLVVVTTRERGASAKGPRSTRRVIRVAA